MTDISEDELSQIHARIDNLMRRLRLRETQIAGYGLLDVPPHIILDKEDAEHELRLAQAALRRLRGDSGNEQPPYLGLLTFQEADAARFFGRDRLITQLIEQLKHTSMLVVLGPSGSGKSSIVRAGLTPMLKDGVLPGSDHWRYVTMTPGAYPLDTLAAELARLQGQDLGQALALSRELGANNRALLTSATVLVNRTVGERLVLVVDQFEELWTLAPTDGTTRQMWAEQQQQPFVNLLLTTIMSPDTPLLLILTMRADFLHRAAEHPTLAQAIADHDVIVSPMTKEELREAIERPVEVIGCDFEAGLVNELIEQTIDRPGTLPLLEYTLLELWQARATDRLLTWDAFQSLGGVEGSLARRADTILKERYTPDQQDEIRQILLLLVKPGEGTADTRRRIYMADLVSISESVDHIYNLLEPLITARLLTTGRDDQGRETVDVAHESLISAWPTLGQWIGAARDDLQFQYQLEEATREWQRNAHSEDFLWSGVRLARAEEWLVRARPRLAERDREFLDASRRAEQADIAAEEIARREREQLMEDKAKRLRIFLGVVGCLLIITIASIIVTLQAQAHATAEFVQAQHQAADSIAALADGKIERATLLARAATFVDSYRDLPPIALALRQTYEKVMPGRTLPGHQGWVTAVAWSPDGKAVLTGSQDGTARVWDVTNGAVIHILQHTSLEDPQRGAVWAVAWSPNGRQIVTGAWDGTARLWDAMSGAPGRTFQHDELHDNGDHRVWAVTWSPNGQQILTGSWDGTARIWDVASGTVLQRLTCNSDSKEGSVLSVAWKPDGQQIAAGLLNGTVCIWDATSANLVVSFKAHASEVRALAWSPDGKRILTCSIDITARIWDAVSGQQIRLFVGHEDNVRAAAWSPDGKRIITGSDDRTARIWDVDTAQALSTLSGHDGPVWAVGWSPKGDQVITGSFDKTARLWVADSHIMVAGLSQYICGHFTDTQIRTEISAWQGCTAELATMTQDR